MNVLYEDETTIFVLYRCRQQWVRGWSKADDVTARRSEGSKSHKFKFSRTTYHSCHFSSRHSWSHEGRRSFIVTSSVNGICHLLTNFKVQHVQFAVSNLSERTASLTEEENFRKIALLMKHSRVYYYANEHVLTTKIQGISRCQSGKTMKSSVHHLDHDSSLDFCACR